MPEPERAAPGPGHRLRVLTWNLHGLRDDVAAVRRVLSAAGADVVCLQESPKLPGSRIRLAALARATGLLFVAGGRQTAGPALLVSPRLAVHDAYAFRLPRRHWRSLPRGAVLAQVSLPGSDRIALACVHLGLDPVERLQHAELVRDRLAAVAAGRPAVVAGDLNERPGQPAWTAWLPLVTDPAPEPGAATFPAQGANVRIDAVLVDPRLRVQEYGVPALDPEDLRRASDHLPVHAVIELAAAP